MRAHPLLLGIDTALGGLSLSLSRGDQELYGIRHPALNDQAAQLIPCIETVLHEANITYAELDGIAVTVGPGGFTGVRIGLATARALGFAAAKPVYGCTTLALMAYSAPAEAASFLCALPAGRDQVYVQSFGQNSLYAEPAMAAIEDIVKLAESGVPCVITDQPWIEALPAACETFMHDPAYHAKWACRYVAEHSEHSLPALPIYLRPPDAKPQTPLF